jgi:hypothetical protein
MLRTLCLIVALGLASIPGPSRAQAWAEYRPDGIGYSLEMPGEWTITVQDINTAVGTLKGYTATVDYGSTAYMSMYITYPDVVRGKPITPILDGARDGAVANTKGTLRNEQRVVVSNLPAREIVIDTPQSVVIVLRYMMMDNILVQALVAGPKGIETKPDTKRFLESLKVVNK